MPPKRKASHPYNIDLDREQKLALRNASHDMPASLQCLLPVLETILGIDGHTHPPPQKVVKVSNYSFCRNTTQY